MYGKFMGKRRTETLMQHCYGNDLVTMHAFFKKFPKPHLVEVRKGTERWYQHKYSQDEVTKFILTNRR